MIPLDRSVSNDVAALFPYGNFLQAPESVHARKWVACYGAGALEVVGHVNLALVLISFSFQARCLLNPFRAGTAKLAR